MTSRPSHKQRLAQKAQRQREYRQRLKDRRRPSRTDVSVTLFLLLTQQTVRSGEWKKFYDAIDIVIDKLVVRGFDREETVKVIESLVDKIEDGWEFQRKPEFERSE